MNAKKMLADLETAVLECLFVPNEVLAQFGKYACNKRSGETSLADARARADRRIAKAKQVADEQERLAQERTDRAMRLSSYANAIECDRPIQFVQVDERLQNEAMMRFATEFKLFGESIGDEFVCDDCGQHHAACLCR